MKPPVEMLEAAAFTFGCVMIHEWREQADRVTELLIGALMVVTIAFVTVDSLTFERTETNSYDMLGAMQTGP